MKIILGFAVAILTFLTVYIACICEHKWYKLLISGMFAAIVTVLVTSNFSTFWG